MENLTGSMDVTGGTLSQAEYLAAGNVNFTDNGAALRFTAFNIDQ